MMKPFTLLLALAACFAAVATHAGTIDLRLDVTYAGANPSGGGTWKLFARSNESGLFSLAVPLSGINASITNEMPRGRVNGSATDNAGFSVFTNQNFGYRQLYFGQQVAAVGSQQGVFYGVGTLDNGSPNFPGRVAGTTFLGPNITTLTSVQKTPWAAAEDTLWATGVTVASGTFATGATPGFATLSGELQGSLLTSVGSISTPGDFTLENLINTSVRTNLGFGVATGDYTGDGRVDAADYTFWRDRENLVVPVLTSADGNGDGVINSADLLVWRNNYGRVSAATAAAVAIPEPASVFLAAFSLFSLGCGRAASCRRRGIRKDFAGIA